MATVKVCDMCKLQKPELYRGRLMIESTHAGIFAMGEVAFYVDGTDEPADICLQCIRNVLSGEKSRASQAP